MHLKFSRSIFEIIAGSRVVSLVQKIVHRIDRYANIDFAINDAFKRARRQLQDRVRHLRSQVKTHAEPPIGTVTTLNNDFGFLETADGREVYFHRNSVLNEGFARLKIGTRVTFAEEMGEKGPQASTVKLLGKHGLL